MPPRPATDPTTVPVLRGAILAAVFATAFATALALSPMLNSHVHADEASPATTIAHGTNAFGLDLYQQLRVPDGNLFFSPYSVRMALAMTYAGARGETAAQMHRGLRFSLEGEALHAAYGASLRALEGVRSEDVELVVANGLWGERSSPFLPPFAELVDRAYGAGLELVDFRHASETARQRINEWVEARTRERIRELIPAGGVNPDTRLVLVNAVYFDGRWLEAFDDARTREAPFFLADGGSVPVPLMRFTEAPTVPFYEGDGYSAVELDYLGGEVSMLVVLPDAADGLPGLEDRVDPAFLERLLAAMAPEPVEVLLPRFTLTWGAQDLAAPLQALGVHDLFVDGVADLSGIDGSRELFVSGVFHKAFVDVHEEGTEAAAATGVVVGITSMPPPAAVFRADRPFLFLIREKASGAILFMGRLVEPSAG